MGNIFLHVGLKNGEVRIDNLQERGQVPLRPGEEQAVVDPWGRSRGGGDLLPGRHQGDSLVNRDAHHTQGGPRDRPGQLRQGGTPSCLLRIAKGSFSSSQEGGGFREFPGPIFVNREDPFAEG